MEKAYFYCEECYCDKYSKYICVTDINILENILDSNYMVFVYCNLNCVKCRLVGNLIDQSKYIRAKYGEDIDTKISKRRVENYGYTNEHGLFELDSESENMEIFKITNLQGFCLSNNAESVTIEDFLNKVKLKSIINIFEIPKIHEPSRINIAVEYIEKYLADKHMCIKNIGKEIPSNYFIVTEDPFIKSAIKI